MVIGSEIIRVAVAGLKETDRNDVVAAMTEKGWSIAFASDVQELASMAATGIHHLAVIAHHDPSQLSPKSVRTLMSLQTDMSVIFLTPKNCDITQCPPLVGATSDQMHGLDIPTEELMEVLQSELQSVLSNQPEYTIVCVDDDEEFLTSLRALLSARLKKSLPRFNLELESFTNPQEALSEITSKMLRAPAVIISDQMMPEMEGIQLLKQVKEFCPEARCVLLTGHAALDSAVTAINDQVLDKYYFKPVDDPVDFINNIRHMLLEHHLKTRTDTQRDRLTAQFEFIRLISSAKTLDNAMSVTLGFLREQFQPQQALIALGHKDGCSVRAGFGFPGGLSIGTEVSRLGIFEQILQNRRPLVTCAADAPSVDGTGEAFAPGSLLGLPMSWGDMYPGVILMAGRSNNKMFARDERTLASFIADVAAMTVSGFEDRHALEEVYLGTIATLMETVEAKDEYTRGHTDRVTELADALAKEVGVKGEQLENIRRAAALHDIGKIAVPDRVMLKPGALDADEYSLIKEHPARADRILQHLRFLDSVRIIARAHHERYDGNGYPDRLQGEEIPLGARILTIVDSYDAMTSVRSYRKAMSPWDALAEIQTNAGKQFDPKLAMVFLKMMERGDNLQRLSATKVQAVSQDRSITDE